MDDEKNITPIFSKRRLINIIIVFLSLMLILIVIFPIVLIQFTPCACEQIFTGVRVERINYNEISIVKIDYHSYSWNSSGYPYHILVNGHDVSNMDMIQRQGLSDKITPPEGLSNQTGSHVNLTGSDFFQYKWGGVNVVVSEDFYEKPTQILLNMTV